MSLRQKILKIEELTGWDTKTLIMNVVRAIPKRYAEPDGSIPMRYTEKGADIILARLQSEQQAARAGGGKD